MPLPYQTLSWYVQDEPIEGTDNPSYPRGVGNRPLFQLLENDLELEDEIRAIWNARGQSNGFAPLDEKSLINARYLLTSTPANEDVVKDEAGPRWRSPILDPTGLLQTGLDTSWWSPPTSPGAELTSVFAEGYGPLFELTLEPGGYDVLTSTTHPIPFTTEDYPLVIQLHRNYGQGNYDRIVLEAIVKNENGQVVRQGEVGFDPAKLTKQIVLQSDTTPSGPTGKRELFLRLKTTSAIEVPTRVRYAITGSYKGVNNLAFFDIQAAIHQLARGHGLMDYQSNGRNFVYRFSNGLMIQGQETRVRYDYRSYRWTVARIVLPVAFVDANYLTFVSVEVGSNDLRRRNLYSRVGQRELITNKTPSRFDLYIGHYPSDRYRRNVQYIVTALHVGRWKP